MLSTNLAKHIIFQHGHAPQPSLSMQGSDKWKKWSIYFIMELSTFEACPAWIQPFRCPAWTEIWLLLQVINVASRPWLGNATNIQNDSVNWRSSFRGQNICHTLQHRSICFPMYDVSPRRLIVDLHLVLPHGMPWKTDPKLWNKRKDQANNKQTTVKL